MKYPNPKSYDKKINPVQDKTLKYMYFMDKEHPLSDKKGRVYYHRHVASLKINKWIDSSYHVHHKDDDRTNNSEDNLKITSQKMHNREHSKQRGHKVKSYKKCLNCNKNFATINEIFCSVECMGFYNRLFEISKEKLEKLVWSKPTIYIAKDFNVSDVAIGKRCKLLDIKKPPRGYWAKINGKNKHSP